MEIFQIEEGLVAERDSLVSDLVAAGSVGGVDVGQERLRGVSLDERGVGGEGLSHKFPRAVLKTKIDARLLSAVGGMGVPSELRGTAAALEALELFRDFCDPRVMWSCKSNFIKYFALTLHMLIPGIRIGISSISSSV